MKLLVFSDSHGATDLMEDAIRIEQPDRLLHLGDVVQDALVLAREYPRIPIDYVSGNCDSSGAVPPQKTLLAEGRRILMTHGHPYHVKSSLDPAIRAAQNAQADLLLFGHTHRPLCDRQGPLWILNPGSIHAGPRAAYGVILLEKGETVCYTVSTGK